MTQRTLANLLISASVLLSLPDLRAASGTWTNLNGGSWGNPANWVAAVPAVGPGSAANFSTLSLPADVSVSLDGSRTIGTLTFDDKSGLGGIWTLITGTGGTLTLSGTSPGITVLDCRTTFDVPLAGTNGLTKAGTGKLTLAGTRGYSGPTIVSAGILAVTNATFSTGNPLNISVANAVVESAGTLNLEVNTTGTAVDILGAGMLRLASINGSSNSPDIYFGPNHSGNNCWSARLATALDLGSTQRFIYGKTGHNGVGPYGLNGADCQFAGPISGSGGLTFIAQNSWTGSGPMEVPFALNAANTFTGPVEIQRGSIYLGNSNALTQGNVLTFNALPGSNARLFLYGNNALVSDLSSPGSGSALIANGNLKSGGTVTLGPVTLVVTQNRDATFNGILTDVCPEYTGSGAGTTGPLNLQKQGPGCLRLSGSSTYSGSTLVSAGTLEVGGALGATTLTVAPGGTLSGGGEINGRVNIQLGGTISPGSSGLGSLRIAQVLQLAGTTRMELSKVGTTLASDRLTGLSSVSYGGILFVTNISDIRTGALAAGETFTLFEAASRNGAFSSINLPPLSPGLKWDTENLLRDGSFTVFQAGTPPLIVSQPQETSVVAGSDAVFVITAAGARPFGFQWLRDGNPISSATTATFTLSNTTTNDQGSFSVIVTNVFGSVTSQVARLSVFSAGLQTTLTNALRVYLTFDNNIDAQAGTTNPGTLYTGGAANGPRYKPGMIGEAASFANTPNAGQPDDWAITLGDLEWIYSGNFSISLWERTASSGDSALMGNKNWTSGANVGWVISSLDAKNLNYAAAGGTRRDIGLNPPFSDGQWHLVTITFDRQANQVISYVDGVALGTSDISPSGTASLNAGFPTIVGSSGNGTYSASADIDDLGVWTRVLTPEEVSGIYGAGLKHNPLTMAVPGQSPTISAQPMSINVAATGQALFTVTVSGPGPLSYQWLFNGANIAGATNATLLLSSVASTNQGLYTVLVSNGSGAVLSSGAYLSVYTMAVTGQWDFETADLRATAGADWEFQPAATNPGTFPLVMISGQECRALNPGNNDQDQGYYVRHGVKPNGGGRLVNQYSLILDARLSGPAGGRPRALLETHPFDLTGTAAELLLGESVTVPGTFAIGAEGEYHGSIVPGNWYRMAFAVDLSATSGEQLSTYLNGVKIGAQALSGGIDGRYALGPAALLFSGSSAGLPACQLNSVQWVNGCLSADAVAALGPPTAAGLPAGNSALRISSFSQNASMLTLTWTGPDGQYQLQKSNSLTDPVWQNVASLTNSRRITVPVTTPTEFYRVTQLQPDIRVGQLPGGEQSLPSKQIVRAAGDQVQFAGRPVDLALSPDGSKVYVKNINNLLVLDAALWKIRQTLNYPGAGASMHGIAVSADGSRVYVTGAANELYEWSVAENGVLSFSRTIALPAGSYPCGLALSANAARVYVCLSILNRLCEVDLSTGAVTRQMNVGIAPWDVALSPDGTTAYVSDWGGRFPVQGEDSATSAGTAVLIDKRGVAASGAVSFVNLTSGTETAQLRCGLHPSDLELTRDGSLLYVANANSDTVTVIDTQTKTVKETIVVRPDGNFPYGSAAVGLSLSKDEGQLFVACGGNNAVAVIRLSKVGQTNSIVEGFLPADWYPGAVVSDSNSVYVVNVKGLGSRLGQPTTSTWQIGAFLGTATRMAVPNSDLLGKWTAQAFEDGRIREIRQAHQLPQEGRPPVPLPLRRGEPSVFQHALYILKENKTYDQMFGDLPQGNGEPNLCIYPRLVSPNHHALAEEYVLLDNFYCNGVNSADGHSWSTEANNTDHLEKSFGGFSRSYTFGDDPLTYSSTGFIWNNVLEHGRTFRNYGEMDYASTSPEATWSQIYGDYLNQTHRIRYVQNIGIASLRPFSSTNVPGWNMGIPDVVRAEGFIKELNEAQARGWWESFHLLYLPNDHTGGPPSPRAQVADNDLALGRVVEAVTKSAFGTNTVIFVIEDDPQSGYDHVDAHRSICLVVSPYTKRRQVVSTFYNQAGVLHTMERILGLPPMNQQDAMAPLMFDCFTNVPDFRPYTALPNGVSLTEGLARLDAPATSKDRYWAKQLKKMDFSRPDKINDDLFNRYIWYSVKGDAPYPARFVGGHGKGLKALGLVLDPRATDEDD